VSRYVLTLDVSVYDLELTICLGGWYSQDARH
jgi:hypothetical protein